MPVAEAGRAAKLIVQVNVEVARLTPVTPLTLHILFAVTLSRFCVTTRPGKYTITFTSHHYSRRILPIAQAAFDHAFAGLAALAGIIREVPVVGLAHVALVARYPGLALTLAIN